MRKLISAFISLCCLQSFAMPSQIVLIRHAEKPSQGHVLSEKGWKRAKALPKMFQRPEYRKYGKPAALFAMAPKDEHSSLRAIQTLEFLSAQLNLPLRADYNTREYRDMVKAIRQDRSLDGRLVVICWGHEKLEEIAEELSYPLARAWPDGAYDRAWVLTYNRNGQPTLENRPQKLLPGDSKL